MCRLTLVSPGEILFQAIIVNYSEFLVRIVRGIFFPSLVSLRMSPGNTLRDCGSRLLVSCPLVGLFESRQEGGEYGEYPTWKWEDISMDFIVGLPKTGKGYDSIWVIIDRLTKIAHFLPVRTKYTVATYATLYIARILSLHGVPKTIVSDRGPQFVSKFWEELHKSLGTKLLHSSAYHPQTSGQTERVNQVLEDMLRACVLDFSQKWDECLPLAEFSYNNSYQESIKMAPFEALYGRRCRTPLNWSEPGERYFFRPDLVKETEDKVQKIIHNMKKAQTRQKSYVDRRRQPLCFLVGDYVYLKVSPMKGVSRFGIKGKLAPRHIGPFPVLEQCGPVAYQL
jgi:hypothetical protein